MLSMDSVCCYIFGRCWIYVVDHVNCDDKYLIDYLFFCDLILHQYDHEIIGLVNPSFEIVDVMRTIFVCSIWMIYCSDL